MTEKFTREAVARLSEETGEPSWLAERRLEAFDLFEKLEMPDPKGDEWRYTDVRGFDFDAFNAPVPATGVPALPNEVAAKGVIFTDFRTAAAQHGCSPRRITSRRKQSLE